MKIEDVNIDTAFYYLETVFYYMWNAWSKDECQITFRHSQCGWQHFWDKWCGICNRHGVWGAFERFYSELDTENKTFLITRANEVYEKKRRREIVKLINPK